LFDQLSAIVTGLHRVMSAVTSGARTADRLDLLTEAIEAVPFSFDTIIY
jgi:hypothetical protein